MTDHRELNIGSILDRGFEILMDNAGALAVLALVIVGIPSLLLRDTLFAAGVLDRGLWTGIDVSSIILTAAQAILVSSVMVIVFRQLAGNRPLPLQEAIRHGFSTVLPVIGVSLVTGLLTGIGFWLFILPGILLSILWMVAVPAASVERLGITAAMRRSADLTDGHRWTLLGLLVILWLVTAVASFLARLIFSIVGLGGLGAALVATVLAAFNAIIFVIIYRDLRVMKGETFPLTEDAPADTPDEMEQQGIGA